MPAQNETPTPGSLDIRDDLKAIVRDKWRRKEQLATGEKMVGWFNIQQLIRTGMEVVVSSTLERHNDRRLFQALETKDATFHDYSIKWEYKSNVLGNYTPKLDAQGNPEKKSDIWIDYISDLGDGWDSTYAVAYYANQARLELGRHDIPRGELVIFGGDEVYPTATREEYTNRLAKPYQAALPEVSNEERPHLFAIPGNHDWYDSLSNFTNLFLDNHYFGNWRRDGSS